MCWLTSSLHFFNFGLVVRHSKIVQDDVDLVVHVFIIDNHFQRKIFYHHKLVTYNFNRYDTKSYCQCRTFVFFSYRFFIINKDFCYKIANILFSSFYFLPSFSTI